VHRNITWEYTAAPELKSALAKLEARFGPRLNVLPSDPEWLTFQVYGLTDEVLIRTLEREQVSLFGRDLNNFQVVCRLDGKEKGVSIRHLRGGALTSDPGFWYY
jgi:hypothetical protein